jgi:CHAT domain-containing protein/tetratricopeptide (TPR) repeat protein
MNDPLAAATNGDSDKRSNVRPSRACPESESLAAYLDGRATAFERVRIEQHLAICDACYETLCGVIRSRSAKSQTRPLFPYRRVAGFVAVAAAASIVLFFSFRAHLPGHRVAPELAELVAANGKTRTIEPRLTGGFAYGRLMAAVRGEASPVESNSTVVRSAVARIERTAEEARTPENLAALGVAYLTIADVDRATTVLEESTDVAAPSARSLSDLAAAYLVKAEQQHEPHDIAKAVSLAGRAAASDPSLAEASFNLALGLERLFLTDQASQAWERYLKQDPRSGWAEEARRHLEELNRTASNTLIADERLSIEKAARARDPQLENIVRRLPGISREWVESELLTSWPRAYLSGQESEARAIVERSRHVAEILTRVTEDRFLQAAVDAIENATVPELRTALARAHESFARGMAKYEEDSFAESFDIFESVRQGLEQAQSPYALWTRLQSAIALFRKADLAGAARELEPVIRKAEQEHYIHLGGLLHRMRGLIFGVQASFSEQVADYRVALRSFERVQDLESVAAIHASLAESMDFQGESRTAWIHRSQALAGLANVHKLRRRQPILLACVTACLRQGLPHAALFFQEAVLATAREWNKPIAVAEAYLKRAEVHHQLALDELGRQDLAEAERALQQLGDNRFAGAVRAGIQLTVGEIRSRSDPTAAVASVTTALDYYRGAGLNWASARAYLARGRAWSARGRGDLAEDDFAAGIRAFEEQRDKIGDESVRVAYFEQPWDLFSEMVRLKAVRQNDPGSALRFAERARSRTLLEAMSGPRRMQPVDPVLMRSHLPHRVSLVYFAVLEDSVFIWVLRRDRFDFHHRSIRESELVRLVSTARSADVSDSRRADAFKRLYDELIRPAQASIPEADALVIVADRALHTLPFSALIDRETGRYLVQDHAIAMAPSMTVFLELARPSRAQLPRSVLAIGNPQVDGEELNLPDLPGAENEARDTVTTYPAGDLLTRADATKDQFLARMNQHDVVHFAGHAISNTTFPALSKLLLAPTTVRSGSLFAHELAGRRFTGVTVLVLAGCRTSTGQIRRGEGVLSLARPFLAAGIPVVVATLWDLDDSASRPLFSAFHKALRRGLAPADALREAQLSMLRSDRIKARPLTWAGVVAISGIAGLEHSNTEMR